ncbi:protein IMPAIRED IN BABA-INDUCED STERILITY 1-like [Cynara cardunculus var. scolymus]|uniref:protein IMPAIRED IN BABA-INDUCED STERILITY 1-like n=1 Tax=Cynara cardunculus var. scolymus TaxID=59895 RepID=UPI000D62E035|nr:protein IMPAIRED IN BABA-INDUCED STERILITY 1-like [Cynara cardunculus var. scolymus]
MGCISSKHEVRSSSYHGRPPQGPSLKNHGHQIDPSTKIKDEKKNHVGIDGESSNLKFGRLSEAELVAAGWPSWLSEVAGEAIHGWLPLKSDTFQRLEKIGQGTYSSVYRARDTKTGRTVALKKVRFDNLQPESVKFMAREITILRRLDHPNVMKLEGIITSRLSRNIYFVFEYMEHDLSGLLSSPDIKFSDSQIKCYMRQLLNGIEHCHSLGVLHRDIKTANILVNNEGLLKIADFGLANFHAPRSKRSLTSHVVTLWYRPPELLLGCTRYGMYVDLWSIGCVFAELFLGRPILKGRTEVEQLHKIFKLCGTPADDGYWNKSKLPLAAMFKPHHAYESTLRERCKDLPETAVDLLDTFLSVEPCKRGTARSALRSEYFNTKPYACDPASLPKYPPNKEIDAKIRAESCRKNPVGSIVRASGASRNPTRARKTCREQAAFGKAVPPTEVKAGGSSGGGGAYSCTSKGSTKASCDTGSGFSRTTEKGSQLDGIRALTIQAAASDGGFVWETRRRKHGGGPTPVSKNEAAVAVFGRPMVA